MGGGMRECRHKEHRRAACRWRRRGWALPSGGHQGGTTNNPPARITQTAARDCCVSCSPGLDHGLAAARPDRLLPRCDDRALLHPHVALRSDRLHAAEGRQALGAAPWRRHLSFRGGGRSHGHF